VTRAKSVYLCIGENFGFDVPIGDCGKAKTLQKWLEHLYPNKSPEFLKEYFHDEPDSEIVKYIFENKGKRLEKVGK
jgi:hypothetical protein